jgi:predicted nucleic acid-binding protein
MIVYLESNFVLEVALEQEQVRSAEAIMTLAEQFKIKLAFPSFILGELFELLARERRERNTLHNSLVRNLTNLKRSEPHRNVLLSMGPLIELLREVDSEQFERLQLTFEKLLNIGECIHVNAATFHNALSYQRSLNLKPQDSVIYAALIRDLKERGSPEKKCFLSRDRKAFDTEDDDRPIKAELASYNCRYISSFTQGLDYIQHTLSRNAG